MRKMSKLKSKEEKSLVAKELLTTSTNSRWKNGLKSLVKSKRK